jgi:ADP-ribose pyrophosphatase YjhB (NUDIX family)
MRVMDLKIESEMQREILSKCRFWEKGARYSELRSEGVENDLFNYHLQQLVKNGWLKKEEGSYLLTVKGKRLVTNIDEEDKQNPPSFKVSVYMCAVDAPSGASQGKILLYRRLKHPQYGYVGLPSGKIRFWENILETAKREFKEETNLEAEFQVIGNLRQIRRNEKGEVREDGVFYVCFADSVKGELMP